MVNTTLKKPHLFASSLLLTSFEINGWRCHFCLCFWELECIIMELEEDNIIWSVLKAERWCKSGMLPFIEGYTIQAQALMLPPPFVDFWWNIEYVYLQVIKNNWFSLLGLIWVFEWNHIMFLFFSLQSLIRLFLKSKKTWNSHYLSQKKAKYSK